MKNNRIELAVYGKGGIGKSTISANLSAALSMTGRRILQIGCDPKHDSTRLLMHGENIGTVLDYLKDTPKELAKTEEILFRGMNGIGCIEAGGPRPGVGCAGRGIISSFTFLEEHKVKDAYDIIVYDVLGDVVCGGFAVPVRREYADAVFIVTSGEYMALYAANNILRGIRNFDGDSYARVAGIIYNERKVTDEDGRVKRFADAVGLPICVKVPRSNAFAKAEEANRTVMELPEYKKEQQIFQELANRISAEMPLYKAKPLTDEKLEQVVLGTERNHIENLSENSCGKRISQYSDRIDSESSCVENILQNSDIEIESENSCGKNIAQNSGNGIESEHSNDKRIPAADDGTAEISIPAFTPVKKRLPLYGCAFNGAATQAVHLTDAVVICHSPKACAFYTLQNISSPGRKNLFNRGILMPSALAPNLVCTNMGHTEAVFGGNALLQEAVDRALLEQPGAVIVISSCVSGIIGDDMRAVEAKSTKDCPVIVIPADGDINGDYMEGIRMCMHLMAERIIDPSVTPEGDCINLVGEVGVGNNSKINYDNMKDMLARMGIRINCRFLGDATTDELRHFLKAPLNVLATEGPDGLELKQWLQSRHDCRFMDEVMPIGVQATARWLRKIGSFFHKENEAEAVIGSCEEIYAEEAAGLKSVLSGKRLFVTTINVNMDWLLETAADAGMEIVYIGVMNYLHQELRVTEHPERYPVLDAEFEWTQVEERISELKPDLVLSNYTDSDDKPYIIDSIPMLPATGFFSGIAVVKRWAELFETRREGAWKRDRALFDKYFAG